MEKITARTFIEMKQKGEKITMVATYDYLTAKLVEEVGIEAVLVGDSLASVVLGYENTLPVSMEEMLHHTRAVARACKRALVVGDMPFLSYQTSIEDTIKNAGRFLKEGAGAVKMEGGAEIVDRVRTLTGYGIPVMGHLGLTPQKIHQIGGYRVVGREEKVAESLLEDAKELESAGIFALVLECIPWRVAKTITETLKVPTIGIGAGPYCDGQVLVLHDLLGLVEKVPRFVKRYADLRSVVLSALCTFKQEVKNGTFPTLEQAYE